MEVQEISKKNPICKETFSGVQNRFSLNLSHYIDSV